METQSADRLRALAPWRQIVIGAGLYSGWGQGATRTPRSCSCSSFVSRVRVGFILPSRPPFSVGWPPCPLWLPLGKRACNTRTEVV
eukprot:2488845-Amphidinium_carterae.2